MKKNSKPILALIWICAYLAVIDFGINISFPYPKDPRNISPSGLQQFFEFGRSVEGKLARMTRKTDEESAPILATGWIANPRIKTFSNAQTAASKPVVTVYGMSHSVLLAEDMAGIDNSLSVRSFGAPGAVPTWSYAAYMSDKERQYSDVVVLAVMTRGVPLICTTSGATKEVESVWPYTYPRFIIENGTLASVSPPFISLDGYREYFYDSTKWRAYVEWLRKYDKYFDPVLFKKTFLDNSSIYRILHRAYAYSAERKKEARVYDDRKGFNALSEEVQILRLIIENFSAEARRNHSLPIIYIVNNVSMGDHLYRILEPTLAAQKIPFLSSHEICDPNDPRNYLPDSHFVRSINLELAKAMIKVIRENMSSRTFTDLKKK